jgi:hypothetical protein
METNRDVFISHSSADSQLAYAMCHYLEEKGLRCWIAPRNVQGGREYAEAIIMGIRNCKIMVVLFNENANKSNYVKNEVERAFSYQSILIPFKVGDAIPSASLELFLGSVHWIDAAKGNPEDHFDFLYKNCERAIGKRENPIKQNPVLPLASETEIHFKENPVIPLVTDTKEKPNKKKPDLPLASETKENIIKKKPDLPLASETKENIIKENPVLPLASETKENIIKENPILPITTEAKDSSVKDKSDHNQAEKNILDKPINELKTQKNTIVSNEILKAQMHKKGNFPWIEFSGPNGSGRVNITAPEISFGRDKNQVDCFLAHGTISRQHFKIYTNDHKYFLKDLNSSNGTFLNGFKIFQSRLNHGDKIKVGEITIYFFI